MKSPEKISPLGDVDVTNACTACGAAQASRLLRFEAVPVHQNLLYPSYEAARRCRVGKIDLCACEHCGFVFNAAFDGKLLDYSEDYENSQDKSGSFSAHMHSVAQGLVARHELQGKRILEVGCGKGGFLNLIVDIAGGMGKGFDPSYVNEYDAVSSLSFVKDFFPANEDWWSPDQIVCRHVLEHIEHPRDFVTMIRRAIPDGQSPYLYFEVPGFDWICENLAFWDIFYEHCNYFTVASISHLMEECGFDIERIESVFSGQYLSVDLQVAGVPAVQNTRLTNLPDYRNLSRAFNDRMHRVKAQMRKLIDDGKSIAVWGAAAKGSTFLNQLQLTPEIISHVIDINPRKQGNYIAGTGQQICSPEFLQNNARDAIFVMNPNYEGEIRQQLSAMHLFPDLIVI